MKVDHKRGIVMTKSVLVNMHLSREKKTVVLLLLQFLLVSVSEIVCCRKSKYTDSVVSMEVKKSTSKWRDTGLIPADLGAMLTARTCYVDTAHFYITLH